MRLWLCRQQGDVSGAAPYGSERQEAAVGRRAPAATHGRPPVFARPALHHTAAAGAASTPVNETKG